MDQRETHKLDQQFSLECLKEKLFLSNLHSFSRISRNLESIRQSTLSSEPLEKNETEKLWRGQDLNLRPSGYEPDELPNCSTPR